MQAGTGAVAESYTVVHRYRDGPEMGFETSEPIPSEALPPFFNFF